MRGEPVVDIMIVYFWLLKADPFYCAKNGQQVLGDAKSLVDHGFPTTNQALGFS